MPSSRQEDTVREPSDAPVASSTVERPNERQALMATSEAASRSTTFGETVFNMINCFVGAGILTVPFAFSLGGSAAVWGLALVSGLNWQASLILGKAIDAATDLQAAAPRGTAEGRHRGTAPTTNWDLAALGRVAFGSAGERVIRTLMIFELWFALETFLVLTGINVHLVTGMPKGIAIAGSGILGMISLSLSMRTFACISLLSIVCMVGGLLSIVVYGQEAPKVAQGPHRDLDQHAIATSISIFFYCLSGLPCIPNIRSSMRKVSEYPQACHYSFGFAFLYYSAVGLLACHYFGSGVHQSFTENLVPKHLSGHPAALNSLLVLSAGLFAAKLQAGFPLYASPVLDAMGFGIDQQSPQTVWTARICFTFVSVLFAVFAKDDLITVAGLTGAALTTSTSVIFPCVTYVALTRSGSKRLGLVDTAGLVAVLGVGCALGALGTLEAFQTLLGVRFVLPPVISVTPQRLSPVIRKVSGE